MKPREIPILNTKYKVVVCWGRPVFVGGVVEKYRHKPDPGKVSRLGDVSNGLTFLTAGRIPVIALPGRPKTPEEIGTLVHEATHAVEDIFQQIGEDSRNEVYADSISAVVREVLK